MPRMLIGCVFLVLVAFQACPAQAQQAKLPHEVMKLEYTGTYPWIVYLNSTALNFKRKAVADYPTAKQAEDVRDQLNKALPDSSKYFYQADERGDDAPPPEKNQQQSGKSNSAMPPKKAPKPEDRLIGRWESRWSDDTPPGYRYSQIYVFNRDNTATSEWMCYTPGQERFAKVARNELKWKLENGDLVLEIVSGDDYRNQKLRHRTIIMKDFLDKFQKKN